MEEDKKGNTAYRIITIILLIVIIILLLFFNRFGKIDNSKSALVPTGNVDVFDIAVNCMCKNNNCEVTDSNGKVIPIFNEARDREVTGRVFKKEIKKKTDNKDAEEEPEQEVTGEVYVDDQVDNYIYQEKLQIFNNPAYEFTNKIAPGVSNVYHFVVHNSTNAKLKYKIKMQEYSEYKLNMVYRLKNGDRYVVGDNETWVSASKLETAFKKINQSTSDDYSLEWQWKYDGNDNIDSIAGANMDSEYRLNIRVNFEVA